MKSFHFPNCALYRFLCQRGHVGTLQHRPMLGGCGPEPPPLGPPSLITVRKAFIPAEDTMGRCARPRVCGPTSASPAEVPLSPPTCLSVPAHPPVCPRPPEDLLLLPAAAGCGVPPPLPHAVPLWDGDSTVGSRVVYRCARGYRSAANASVCTAGGKWDVASVLCEGVVPQFGLRVAAEFHSSSVSRVTAHVFDCRNQLWRATCYR